jgi:hypothetical protein
MRYKITAVCVLTSCKTRFLLKIHKIILLSWKSLEVLQILRFSKKFWVVQNFDGFAFWKLATAGRLFAVDFVVLIWFFGVDFFAYAYLFLFVKQNLFVNLIRYKFLTITYLPFKSHLTITYLPFNYYLFTLDISKGLT